MLSRIQIIVVSILLLTGLLVALKLFQIDYMVNYSSEPYKSFCNVNETFNCDAVAASPFSHIFGIPIAFIGAISNLFLLIFLTLGQRLKHFKNRMKQLYLAVFFLYAIGCLVLAFISFLFIPAYCFVCMIFWALSIATFIYLCTISDGLWKNPQRVVRDIYAGIRGHKLIIAFLLLIYVSINVYTGYSLSYCGCHKKGKNPLQCEHFDSSTHTAYLGRESAKMEVVIYTDFQCPWCNRAHFALMDMIKKHEKQVRFVRKDFPLDMECNPLLQRPFHTVACKAAYYAKCAGQQGKYWEYHDELYRNQEILTSEGIFENIGKMLSLDIRKLRDCAESEDIRIALQKDIAEAIKYRIDGTPTFRIFGELFSGMISEENLEDYLLYYPAIKAHVLKRIYDSGSASFIQIIDIREPQQFENGHIEGALNIPLATFKNEFGNVQLQEANPTLIYDQDGSLVTEAFNILRNRGFSSIHTLFGGYSAWISVNRQELGGIFEVNPEEALALIKDKIDLIIDLRTREEFNESHIRGAKHMAVEDLSARLSELADYHRKRILLYCRTIIKSRHAAQLLHENGFSHLFILKGGMSEWKEKGLPVIRQYQ